MAVISINTTDSKKVEVGLRTSEKEDKVIEEIDKRSSQRVLLLIDFLLRQNNLSISEIDEIRVSSGPGSFTGIKVGVSIANALGFALGVPVNGKSQAKPKYE
ncbi:MAG: tRNA (adenosine(37)-N6)-threonylcarbamoyltransferase complex dimerization subunit type 1 TsaB [Patescibacteria group bacterium]